MKFFIVYTFCLLTFLSCQNEVVGIPYFDKNLPSNTPKIYSSDFISIPGRKEGNGVFTPDGKHFLYIEVSDSNDLNIMQMDYENEAWSSPQKASFSNEGDTWEPFITHDGKSIYFISNRSTTSKWDGRIWTSDRTESGWSAPVMIDIPIETDKGFWFPSYAQSGKLYFGSFADTLGNQGKSDIYLFDTKTGQVSNVGISINTAHEEWDPFISKDESYMLFASDRPGGLGKVDTYISFKTQSGWSAPINLGESINSEEVDVAAKVTPDERFIFFDRPKDGEQDIYWVSAKIIDDLKKQFYTKK